MSLSVRWLSPDECEPPHRVTHPEKKAELARSFALHGWGDGYPTLIGYEFDGIIRLLSGSHRWAAAQESGIQIPVIVRPRRDVEAAWGDLDEWYRLMWGDRI